MPTACLYNFSDYEFIGSWNGETQAFAPHSKTYMPAFLAQHFAKHLVNRELHRAGLDNATSPKAPEDQPEFFKRFQLAYIRERSIPGQKRNTLADMINAVDKNMKAADLAEKAVPGTKDTLGPDVLPTAPREVSEKEDPNYLPEKAGDVDAPHAAARSNAPQIVDVPEDDQEDEGYEGVPVGPQSSASQLPVATTTN